MTKSRIPEHRYRSIAELEGRYLPSTPEATTAEIDVHSQVEATIARELLDSVKRHLAEKKTPSGKRTRG